MLLKNVSNSYNLLLSLAAFYTGINILTGTGVFSEFPQEWVGKIPFNSWESIAIFGILIFGFGNAIAAIYGFIKKGRKIFIMTLIMGVLFLSCMVLQIILLDEVFLATVQFILASSLQLFLGLVGLVKTRLISN
ncbi:hypothetical protein [Filobacillus milosensis]|uniref:hypothetical protein n=1 Tax=Filobacillus milosensis TaxID=94137 RepID=UPI00106D055D|nr:hypothetical protein [Filobacillus milosensis]